MKHLLKKVGEKQNQPKIENIDFIYLINLDKRPDKLQDTLEKLYAYGLSAHRFSAIDGWSLSPQEYLSSGIKFQKGMHTGEHQSVKACLCPRTKRHYEILNDACIGKNCFYPSLSLGAVGCALSHLSILQDAYDTGYETIFVFEDDLLIQKDPRTLSHYMEKLTHLDPHWDVLFTDDSHCYRFTSFYPDTTAVWRPNRVMDSESLLLRRAIGEDFFKISGRLGAHSMIIRREGIKKILDFLLDGIFLPYDLDLVFVPNLAIYNLKESVIARIPPELCKSDTDINQADKQFHN